MTQRREGIDWENRRTKQKEWRLSNKETLRKKKKVYYETVYKEIQADKERILRIKHPEILLYKGAKSRAEKRGLEFSLNLDDIVVPLKCPVLGIILYPGTESNGPNSPSLDRIFNDKGYTKDNIQVISNKANRMKNDSTFEEIEKLYLHMKKILNVEENCSTS